MLVLRVSLFFAVLLSGCERLPESFPPPAQRVSLETAGLAHFIAMSDPDAGAYLVQGFRLQSEGPWRWAHEHPVLRFNLPALARAKFTMVFALPEQTFRLTGPVTLAFS